MPVRTRVLDTARYRADGVRRQIGEEIRAARMAAGLPQRSVSSAVGHHASWLSRVERGSMRSVTVEDLVVVGAAAGLKVWIAAYAAERAIVDAPQILLLRRLRGRIGEHWAWQFEVVLPAAGDQRAADAVIRRGSTTIMIEAFTRLADAQAQLRRVHVKARDLGIERVVVVVAATNANRRALASAADVLAASFPLSTRPTLAALAAGRDPGANGLVLI
jgi:transcriptional regulator with XRE-family HTH domain